MSQVMLRFVDIVLLYKFRCIIILSEKGRVSCEILGHSSAYRRSPLSGTSAQPFVNAPVLLVYHGLQPSKIWSPIYVLTSTIVA